MLVGNAVPAAVYPPPLPREQESQVTETTEVRATLPGESEALPMRYGGEPITPEEALGVARRHARVQASQGRKLKSMGQVDKLPAYDANLVQSAHRFPPRLLFFVKAKAEMEGVTVTEVLTQALEAYASSPPGARVQYIARRPS